MGAPTFVNGGSNTGVFNNAGGGTNTCLISWAQTANDTLVIVIAYHGVGSQPTVGVTDTAGNGYTVTAPAGSVDLGFGNGLCVATATGIHAAGANTNTVSITFTGATPGDDIAIITEYSASAGLDSTSPTATVIAGTTPSTSYTTGFGGVLAIQMAYDSASYTAATGAWTDRSGSTALSNGLNYADQSVVTAGTVVNTSINGASGDSCILMIGLQGTGAITGDSDVVFTASASATGAGALSGTSAVTSYASAYLPQFAKLGDFDTAASAITWFDGTEDVGGWWDRVDIPSGPPGAIVGTSGVVFSASGTLTGAGALTGESDVIFTAAGTLQGAGALVGSAAVVSTASGTLSGSGALVGASNVIFAAQATPSQSGASSVIFAASATLSGAGALAGESDAVFTASGTLRGAGTLAGESDVVFGASGTTAPQLAGRSSVAFSASATPSGARPVVVPSGQFTFGGSLQQTPQPLGKRKRRFKTAAEILAEKEARLRELEAGRVVTDATLRLAELYAEEKAGSHAHLDRKQDEDRPGKVAIARAADMGIGRSVFVADVRQHASGTTLHMGRAVQAIDGGQKERADAATTERDRLEREARRWKRQSAKMYITHLHAAAIDAHAALLALSDVDLPAAPPAPAPPVRRAPRSDSRAVPTVRLTAEHEAGHALANLFWMPGRLAFVDVVPRPGVDGSQNLLGFAGAHDWPIRSRDDALRALRVYVAGFVAEELTTGRRDAVVSAFFESGRAPKDQTHDIAKAKALLQPHFGIGDPAGSDRLNFTLLVGRAFVDVRELLQFNRTKLDALAARLTSELRLDAAQVVATVGQIQFPPARKRRAS